MYANKYEIFLINSQNIVVILLWPAVENDGTR